MATINVLLGSNIKWNHNNHHVHARHAPPDLQVRTKVLHIKYSNNLMISSSSSRRSATCTTRLSVIRKNYISAAINYKDDQYLAKTETTKIPSKNPIEILAKTAILLVGFLLLWHPNSSLAASGGCMGGSSFGSSSDYSSDSSDYSSYSSDWPSYSSPSPSPSRPKSSCSCPKSSGSSSSSCSCSVSSDKNSKLLSNIILLFCGAYIFAACFNANANAEKKSIIKLQVGLLGEARSLQTDLNQLARKVDTSTKEGLIYILKETASALLRRPNYCMFGYCSVDMVTSIKEAEERFKKHSTTEMAKFDEITLVNVNNVRKEVASTKRATGVTTDYIVVTILAAVQGTHKLPTINGRAELKEALEKLSSIPLSKILAVEVLWTPQLENDTLSEQELRMKYSLLHPL